MTLTLKKNEPNTDCLNNFDHIRYFLLLESLLLVSSNHKLRCKKTILWFIFWHVLLYLLQKYLNKTFFKSKNCVLLF